MANCIYQQGQAKVSTEGIKIIYFNFLAIIRFYIQKIINRTMTIITCHSPYLLLNYLTKESPVVNSELGVKLNRSANCAKFSSVISLTNLPPCD